VNLRIYFRQYQNLDESFRAVVYSGSGPATIINTFGTVPIPDWVEVTDDVDNLEALRITFTLLQGNTSDDPKQNRIQKSASNSLIILGQAYQMLKAWLLDHVAAPLHQMEVRITDDCGQYVGFTIHSSQLAYCEDGQCQYDVTMAQQDAAMTCIKRTVISDNWQGWFQEVPRGGKKHPRFIYCNEERPNAKLVITWYLIQQLQILTYIVFTLAFPALALILGILTVIKAILDAVADIIGTDSFADIPTLATLPDYGDLSDFFGNLYVESAGCGREHPAPLIRDYIQNVCDKCGVTVTAQSAPILFAETLQIDSSSDGVKTIQNPYYNACYLRPDVQRGIRSITSRSPFFGVQNNNTDYYIPDNAPLESLDMFLDRIKGAWNAEWYLRDGTLIFQRTDYFEDPNPLYDFRNGGADRNKIVEGVCFDWNERRMPAYGKGLYNVDALDSCGNEALSQQNGLVLFGNKENNPMFEGGLDMTLQGLSGARFRFDGAGPDYITDAMAAMAKFSTIMNGPLQLIAGDQILKDIDGRINGSAGYALLLKDEMTTLPKILIWDGASYEAAKCVRNKIGLPNRLVPSPVPEVNPYYNDIGGGIQKWQVRHEPKGCDTGGIYEVRSAITGGIITNQAALLVNYPMYFEPGYKETLWDYWHWIRDPRRNPTMNQNWSVKIHLCCDDLNRLQVYGAGQGVKLGSKIMVPSKYYQEGRLMEVEVNYDTEDSNGMHILLKGTV
jgi:hypothetical protein